MCFHQNAARFFTQGDQGSLRTFIDKPNCVLEDRVQYSTVHIPNVFWWPSSTHQLCGDCSNTLSFSSHPREKNRAEKDPEILEAIRNDSFRKHVFHEHALYEP